ncbi:ricin-type beta-trefoil lectin domain protein, putative [Rhizoctonia solani AG-3 Rhs1AP]|uniref:Ricin-type beta-trefoil lectin domain protein, putative n=1 Tax=Rhizoctonia solani AG-3 Rhs1AP TaxID=1086054 RepID=X8JTS1_9AGAM|nr:ricin-type beta-trefoil lectin domain protein, putative [Rhizoctonia solani AG-3 Rhs1AP]
MQTYAMRVVDPGFQIFRRAMGYGAERSPIDATVEPGMYRIVNKLTGTALQVSEHDHNKIVSWQHVEERKSQWWHLQRSGSGYRFKNRQHNELYISVASTDSNAIVTASRYPSTWVFLKIGDHYGIKLAEVDEMIDIPFGRKTDGIEIRLWPTDGHWGEKQTWDLVRISDDSDEPHCGKCAQLVQELGSEKEQVGKLKETLARVQLEVIEKNHQISQQQDNVRQLREDLEARESGRLQAKLFQQETEIASLQAKIDRLEYLVSQMRGNVTRNPLENH